VTFPVDVVYTWVDGGDPDWQRHKAAVLRSHGRTTDTIDGDDLARFRSHDELRYSLRSVIDHAPFVRHVFVVTDGGVPPWLRTDSERLTIVTHREIFPDGDHLPTFNSHAIESRLHHIPGLAEHYLYLNDDFFFGRPVTADRFFHGNGMTKFFLSSASIHGHPGAAARSVDAAAANTQRLVRERFGRTAERKIKHAPYPQRRSVLYEMEEALQDEFARTVASRLRSTSDIAIPSSLYHYYAYLTGRAVSARIGSRYLALGDRGLERTLWSLRRRRNIDVLCLNDSPDFSSAQGQRRSRALERFMAAYWPIPSPFERGPHNRA
jgi:hypothetical protein